MRFRSVSLIVILNLIPALTPEPSTVHAQQIRYQVHTFSVQDLFNDEEFPEILNRSSANQTRSTIRSNTVSGVTLIGTMPLWVFPISAAAALEPEFGAHPSITGSLVPEARLPCIPSIGSSEYQRLMGIRDQVYGEIVREFSQINHWLVGPETSLRFVDCEGNDLGIGDMVTFFVDTLEGLYPIIKREKSNATVIAHFLGDPWIPIVIHGQLVQPREIRRRIRQEIRQRAAAASNFYDVLVENLDPALVRNRVPENIPPFDFSTTTTSPRDAVPNPCSTPTGWCVKWVEEFGVEATNLVSSYSLWNDWQTDTSTVQLTVMKVVTVDERGRAQLRLSDPLGSYRFSIAGSSTTPDSSSGSDIVPDVEMAGNDAKRHRWTAVQDFYTAGAAHERAKVAHAAVFLRVRNRMWIPKENGELVGSVRYPNQTRFGAFVYGPNPVPESKSESDCSTSWCGTLEFVGDEIRTDSMPTRKLELFHFPLKKNSATEKHLWNDTGPMATPSLYRVQVIEEKRSSMLYWKAQVWKNPGTTSAYLAGESEWVSQWEVENMHFIDIPGLTGSRISIGLGPLPSVCSDAVRTEEQEVADCIRDNTPNPNIGIDVERVGTAYWRYSE